MRETSRLKPRRSPEPGRPFVNREHELRLIESKLKTLTDTNRLPSPIMCFWGAFGMGKSWLLIELERLYKRTDLRGDDSYSTVTGRLDLNQAILPAIWQDGKINRVELVRELWRQLAKQFAEEDVPDLKRATADTWAKDFVKQVTVWLTQRSVTPIIMLDTVDDLVMLDEDSFLWLEEHLVEGLAMTDQVLFVFTSRGELRRWERFQVRRRVDSHRLVPFDRDTAGQEVGANPGVSKLLFKHAFGHPLVTEYLGTELERQGGSLKEAREAQRLLEPSLVKVILSGVIDEILRAVPELSARLAQYASVLRWVSAEPLRFLAERLRIVEPGHGDAYYLDLIGELQANHLLYWNSSENNYEFDPALRRLLAYCLKLDEQTQFCAAHLAAFDFHREHLDRYPQYLARYLPELAYHRAILDYCESMELRPPTLQVWWEKFLSEVPLAHYEPWTELLEVLDKDVELKEVMSIEDYRHLHSEAQIRAVEAAG